MANYAAIIDVLSVSGSRLSDGTPNSSGKVWFFQPGTNTPVNVYSDAEATAIVTQPIVLNEGGSLPSNVPNGLFTIQRVRVYIEDANAVAVDDFVFVPGTAAADGLNNVWFTADNINDALTALGSSLGGVNGAYLVALGQTPRPYHDVITELCVSVKSFGAVGDGIAIDTTSIQNAINFVISLGGGTVYFPPGTYLVDHTLTLTSATGVRVVGSGSWASIISTTSATENTFTFSSCVGGGIDGIRIDPVAANTGAGIATVTCDDFIIRAVTMKAAHDYGLDNSGNGNVTLVDSTVVGAVRGIRSTGGKVIAGDSTISSAAVGVEFATNAAQSVIYNCNFAGAPPIGVLFDSALAGTKFVIYGCVTLGALTTPIDMTGLAINPNLRQWGNGVDGYTVTQASGGGGGSSFTPNTALGQEISLRLTSGGAAICTINSSLPVPASLMRNSRLTLKLTAAAGGNITWTFHSSYILVGGGTTVTGTNGNTDVIEFLWDVATTEWRECFRSATAT